MREDYSIKRYEKDTTLKKIRDIYINYTKTEQLCRKCRCHSNNWTCSPFDGNQTSIWLKYGKIN